MVSNSKRISLLDVNALLAHGSTQVARNANLVSGQRNEDYWLRFMQGHTPPDPKAAMVHDKFIARLKGAGLHVAGNGPKLQLMALTDRHVDEMAGDRNVRNAETVNFDSDLKGLDRLGMRPDDWVLNRVPVLPPAYRPVGVLGSGGAPVVADANHLHGELHEANGSWLE